MNVMFSIAAITLPRYALVLGLLLAHVCSAQSYIFESPNTREHMSDESAVQSLDSYEQRNFLAVARYLAGRLCAHPTVEGGLGIFSGSTENTAMVRGCPASQGRYLGELLARYAHQEWLLIFSANPNERGRLVIVSFPGDQFTGIPAEMRSFGLTAGTVLMEGKLIKIYLWEADHAQDEAIRSLAATHQAIIEEITGKATLIGSNARAQAQSIFDQDIATYERRHRWKLSVLLWIRRLRDLGVEKSRSM
ncbi:MAG TPA: hypothetical protein VNW97_07700 [Candidatus Saccharimonadales bacterium]|nr:hypothetical protein [Candidatus Saccharimonadales bacterium]